MAPWDTVAILGVGLMGGSIGLALRSRGLANRIVGVGRSRERLSAALARGAVTEIATDPAHGMANAQFVVVCTPVDQIASDVKRIATSCPSDALITDVGSTKHAIVEALRGKLSNGVRFVGSHPMAGSEKTGVEFAREDLYVGRTVAITPDAQTRPNDVSAIDGFWKSLGAKTIQLPADEHDRLVAMSSHLPHVVASALAAAALAKPAPLVAGGLMDSTRIAAGDPNMWTAILMENRENVLSALAQFGEDVAQFQKALESSDRATLHALLLEAKKRRNALGS